ncbi:MAG TPA: lamin tail domain-containing protein [Candidatus Limnocylindria bacterium]|nr:lamin tail domain-containing protein [Candidatus Limnocylindria bacterium]
MLAIFVTPMSQAGSILREVFTNIEGTSVSDLTNNAAFPDQPALSSLVADFFEAPPNFDDDFGQRMHGYIIPPVSGAYTFWLAADDTGILFLSTDQDPQHARPIATVSEAVDSRAWDTHPEQRSAPVTLVAGVPYYLSALQKDGTGPDNLAVRWLRPDDLDEAPIPADYLQPLGVVFTTPEIAQQPVDLKIVEGQPAIFSVTASNPDPVKYQWFRGVQPLDRETNATLTIPAAALSASGTTFNVSLSNWLGTTNSRSALLSVTADVTAPTLVSATSQGISNLVVVFSEPVGSAQALSPTNYILNNGATVTSVAPGDNSSTVILATSPQQYGVTYTLRVSNVPDRATKPNVIVPRSPVAFIASELAQRNVGGITGSVQRGGLGEFNISAAGADIGGTGDQFQFAWEQRTGNFDVQVRVAAVSFTDLFVHVGLMARATLDTNSVFAGIFAGSPRLGSFFESRTTAGGVASTAAPPNGYPASYPQTWLRLSRNGSLFNGYRSIDGQNWTLIGSGNLILPATVYLGMALCGGDTLTPATAQFRDYGKTVSTATVTAPPAQEPIAPSSRRTGLIISEIMYHPKPPLGVTNNLEYVELHNADSIFLNLGGWRLSGGIQFTFPDGFRLPVGNYVVVAADPAAIQRVYGITNVVGPFVGSLNNAGDTVTVVDNHEAVRLEVQYSSEPPWPAAADGAGHSLSLVRPSYGEADPRAWAISELIGGSPGRMDGATPNPQLGVVINEFLAHTDLPEIDYVELYNHTPNAVDLGGCFITDSAATNKYRLPEGTFIGAGGFVLLDENQLGFRLDAAGETVYLVSSNGTKVIDSVRFKDQENGVASGRWPDGAETIRRLDHPTPGNSNGPWRSENIVINEIMYAPISGDKDDEYVELYNRTASAINLGGWKLAGGISFKFPSGSQLGGGGYLVIGRNAGRLLANYPQLNTNNTLGDFNGSLSGSGDTVQLTMPDEIASTNSLGKVTTNEIDIVVSEVRYVGGAPWPRMADGGGSSLELVDPHADLLQSMNWAASDESRKASWSTVETTSRLDNGMGGYGPNRLFIIEQDEGEALIDNIEIIKPGTTANLMTNGNFELGTGTAATSWAFIGNHSGATIETGDGTNASRFLHLRGQGKGDEGNNAVRGVVGLTTTANTSLTMRASVRWLSGSPEVLLRLRGNWMEMPIRLPIPANLGSPGLPNSRRVANQGPAIYEVTHNPPVPAANIPVTVTCRVSDADGIRSLNLVYRTDPSITTKTLAMHDDGINGDALAGDGLYSAIVPGAAAGTLVGFRIVATDNNALATSTFFPSNGLLPVALPQPEAYIRWGDTVPYGTITHYHMWNSRATDSARANQLNNTYRDITLVYGNSRVIYNAGFRDKGSPFHSGGGSYALINPEGEPLLGETQRIFRSTGNGGAEATGLRNQVCAWIGDQMGIPYLHSHYIQVYRNGGQQYNVSQDEEQPSSSYVKYWFPSDDEGDLYKVAIWFEFQDGAGTFGSTGATLSPFKNADGSFKTARYRWNFQSRGLGGTYNNYTNIFNLVSLGNDSSTNYIANLQAAVDVPEWLGVLSYNRLIGNWDAYGYDGGGQNMYIFKGANRRWQMMPWDIDFTLGDGNGTSTAISGSSDPVLNKMQSQPQFRRMMFQVYQNALATALQPTNYGPVIAARKIFLQKNGIAGVSSPSSVSNYLAGRRTYIQNQIKVGDPAALNVTGNGTVLNSSSPVFTLTGVAPFSAAYITVNDVPYPITWSSVSTFQIRVPLTARTNVLAVAAYDQYGNPLSNGSQTLTAVYAGPIAAPETSVVINEIHYHPLEPKASFVELYNNSANNAFDLSGWHFSGLNYYFPPGSVIQPGGYLVVASNPSQFGQAYGVNIPVLGPFDGSLDSGGEYLRLIKPGTGDGGTNDLVISDVRFDNKAPWPTSADGWGPSLQLIDSTQGSYRVGNWATTTTNDLNHVTPGRANIGVRQSLEAFPSVWINEVLAENPAGPVDNAGEHEPFLELFNSGSVTADLSGYFLSNNYTNLTTWSFPAATRLAAGQFLTVWADGQTTQSSNGVLHANFRLQPGSGSVALARLQGATVAPAVVDFLDYKRLPAGRSFGSIPDGEPRNRLLMFYPTPGSTNNGTSPSIRVTINEIMAANNTTLVDPATGKHEDWFELYNQGVEAVDLAGYSLTDSLANPAAFQIPAGFSLPPNGYLLVWADKTSSSNNPALPDLHANFKLSKTGKQVGLFDPSGNFIDGFTFGAQSGDISYGRYPDGAGTPLEFMTAPTPRTQNIRNGAAAPPSIATIATQSVNAGDTLSFVVPVSDPSVPAGSLEFSLDPGSLSGPTLGKSSGLFTWTPTADQQGSHVFFFEVGDGLDPEAIANGRFIVEVGPPSTAPRLQATVVSDTLVTLTWHSTAGTHYQLQYRDVLDHGQWQTIGTATGDGTDQSLSDTSPSVGNARYYRLLINP